MSHLRSLGLKATGRGFGLLAMVGASSYIRSHGLPSMCQALVNKTGEVPSSTFSQSRVALGKSCQNVCTPCVKMTGGEVFGLMGYAHSPQMSAS